MYSTTMLSPPTALANSPTWYVETITVPNMTGSMGVVVLSMMMGVSSVLLSSVLASSVLMHPAKLESTIRPATNIGLIAFLLVIVNRLNNNYLTYVNNYI